MYSKRLLIASDAYLKVFSLLGANALLFDSRTNQFYTTPYSRRITRFNTVVLIVQIIFGAIRLTGFGNLSDKSDHELLTFNVSYVVLLAVFVPLICLLILTTNCPELVDCFNQALNYIFRIRETWASLSDKEIASSYPTGRFLDWFFGTVAEQPNQQVLYYDKFAPNHKIQHTATSWSIVSTKYLTIFSVFGKGGSLSDKEIASSYPTGTYLEWFFGSIAGLVSGCYGYLLIMSIVSAGIGLVIVASYVAFLVPFHTEFDLKRKSGKHIVHASFRTTAMLPIEYRSLELVHRRVMSHFSLAFVPFQTLVLQFSLFCNWMLLAHWEALGIFRYLMIAAALCLLLFWTTVLQACEVGTMEKCFHERFEGSAVTQGSSSMTTTFPRIFFNNF
ncbi:hypothetical protein Fcan01_16938 [Folsomia candida]|uniref:Uncharacterized protein n=1 Tax=Folsomia candida TaxID=158441 RepID=A0A226DS79_FOLCA|nr:hypothetical protein Fcan01_16938 [Folsomia candida]